MEHIINAHFHALSQLSLQHNYFQYLPECLINTNIVVYTEMDIDVQEG